MINHYTPRIVELYILRTAWYVNIVAVTLCAGLNFARAGTKAAANTTTVDGNSKVFSNARHVSRLQDENSRLLINGLSSSVLLFVMADHSNKP